MTDWKCCLLQVGKMDEWDFTHPLLEIWKMQLSCKVKHLCQERWNFLTKNSNKHIHNHQSFSVTGKQRPIHWMFPPGVFLFNNYKKTVTLKMFEVEMTHSSPQSTMRKICFPCRCRVKEDTLGLALHFLCGSQKEMYLIPGFFLFSPSAVNPCV